MRKRQGTTRNEANERVLRSPVLALLESLDFVALSGGNKIAFGCLLKMRRNFNGKDHSQLDDVKVTTSGQICCIAYLGLNSHYLESLFLVVSKRSFNLERSS